MDRIKKMFSSSSSSPAEAAPQNLGRNDACWCGSGMKYKKCHLREDMHKRVEARYAAQFAAQNNGGIVPRGSKKGKGNRMPEAVPPPTAQ
jgi:hypothetical protein